MRVTGVNKSRSTFSFSPLVLLKLLWIVAISISMYVIFNFRLVDEVKISAPSPGGPKSLKIEPRSLSSYTDMSPKGRARALSDAANTLRCFTIPNCYPTIRCSDGAEPLKIPVLRSYEQQAFCTGDLAAQAKDSKCLVYSFGINDNTEWEEKIANEFGCDVFAFDPTSKFQENVGPGVKFYQLGLQGAGVDVSKTHSVGYEALDPSKLKTLGEIIQQMGHQGRKLDILRLDCEGCEWGVLKQLACSGESQLVKQLMIEFHFQKNLGLATDDDVLVAADAITCLENERWGIASMERSGCGPKDAQYIQSALKFIREPYLLQYITMKRLPEDARWSWDIYGDYIKEDSVQLDFFATHSQKHTLDLNTWPEELKTKYYELGKTKAEIQNVYEPLYGKVFLPEYKKYDEFPLKEAKA